MATPVAWRFGPWATGQQQQQQTQQQSPYADVSSTPIAQPPESPSAYGEIGGGTPSTPGPGVFGQMTPNERQNVSTVTGGPLGWGAAALGMDKPSGFLGGVANAAVNTGVKAGMGLVGAPTGPISALSIMGTLMNAYDALGLNRGIRGVTTMSPAEVQAMTDQYGYGMRSPSVATDPTDAIAQDIDAQAAATNEGWNTLSGGEVDSSNGGLGGIGNEGGAGRDGGADPGEGRGDSSGPAKRGGVFRANRTTNTTWGEPETGGETAIFIPRTMMRQGQQGNESDVERALKRYLTALQR